MNYNTIKFEVNGPLSILTLDRPQIMNALNEEVISELRSALIKDGTNTSTRVLIVTGGEKTFCAGADLKASWTTETSRLLNKACSELEEYPKPTIAAINGYAVGGGLELALACDFRIASNTAKLGTPEVKVGIIPTGGATFRLPRVIGETRAKILMLLGDIISAEQALEYGIISKLSQDNAMFEAIKLGQTLSERPPLSLKAIKTLIRSLSTVDTNRQIELMLQASDELRLTEDFREGRNAFREKRKPEWKGR